MSTYIVNNKKRIGGIDMALITSLLDGIGNKIYPKTKNDAVYNDKGIPLSEQHFLIEGPIELDKSDSSTEFIIKDNRIREKAVVHIYYNNPEYDIKPTYGVYKGYISVEIPEFPADTDIIIIDVVEVVNV
jgi:hypothetical protein